MVFAFFLSTFGIFAQTTNQLHCYYIEEGPSNSINPNLITTNLNHKLTLTFNSQELQDFFDNENVYLFERAFNQAINERLQKVYRVVLDRDDAVEDIVRLNSVVFAERLDQIEDVELSTTPNDYFDHVTLPFAWVGPIQIHTPKNIS